MSVLVDSSTRVLVQGITGRDGSFHAQSMLGDGTHVVAGVTPGKGGQSVGGVPVFDSVSRAVAETGANCSVIFVPAQSAAGAIREAADSGISLIVCITEGIPVLDTVDSCNYVRSRGTRLIGPNSPGIISPGACRVGIMPGAIHQKGTVAVASRSGTLTYEVVHSLTQAGLGQSTCVGVGGDPVVGTNFVEALELFETDDESNVIVLIGEIGGEEEERAADFIRGRVKKPVVAYLAGRHAPPERRMGHAGAIISGGRGGIEHKMSVLTQAGVTVVDRPDLVADAVRNALGRETQSRHGD